MGHQRLGKLPAYRLLPEIIRYLVAGGTPTEDLVDQVTEICRDALKLSQTAAPLPACSAPRSEPRIEPSHRVPLASSLALCRIRLRASGCRIFTPAQPTSSAASLRDFCSGAYRIAQAGVRTRRVDGLEVHDPTPTSALPELEDVPPKPCGGDRHLIVRAKGGVINDERGQG